MPNTPNFDPESPPRLLVVDDDADHLALVRRWLELVGALVEVAAGGREALGRIEQQRPDLVISDLVMGDMDGLRLLSEIHRQDPVLPVMILSGRAAIPDALKAAHLGVSAFLTKPVQRSELLAAITRVLESAAVRRAESEQSFGRDLVYGSSAMQEVMGRARLVAAGDTTVMINGETGTGKELLARAIHAAGPRCEAPFVGINCSALPEQLLESELFGHEKGAFTGALNRHVGLFQTADRGTLFLDEVGDMPLALQAKLLRVLQDFQVRPVGSSRAVPVDVRIISATHRDLPKLVDEQVFREDLFYRLNVVPLRLPPLRERTEDIALLLDHFLTRFAAKLSRPRKRFAPEAVRYLVQARLPGNVRQLQNIVEQCVVLSTAEVIPLSLVSEALQGQSGEILPLDEAKLAFERRYLASLLRTTDGKVANAAKLAGRNRTEFYKLLGRHELDPAAFRRKSPKPSSEPDA